MRSIWREPGAFVGLAYVMEKPVVARRHCGGPSTQKCAEVIQTWPAVLYYRQRLAASLAAEATGLLSNNKKKSCDNEVDNRSS